MPHVIAEAGATRLPVVATPDNGVTEQLIDGVSGLFAPYQDQRPHNKKPIEDGTDLGPSGCDHRPQVLSAYRQLSGGI